MAAKRATATIPVVFETGDDPVAAGLASLARPGGNLTGVTYLSIELYPKRLELLSELVPQAKTIALLVNPHNPQTLRIIASLQEAARAKRVRLDILKAGSENEIDAAFAALTRPQTGGIVVTADPLFGSRREQIIALAARYAIPAIYVFSFYAAPGGLISYGSSLTAVLRRLGQYAGKILRSSGPADLPVEQPTVFELVINLKTAKALGLTMPPSVLALANEVIE